MPHANPRANQSPRNSSFVLLGAMLLALFSLTVIQPWATPLAPQPPGGPNPAAFNPIQHAPILQSTVSPLPTHQHYPPDKKEKSEASDGALRIVSRDPDDRGVVGEFCPLKHTDVQAEISGFLARVNVTQEFVNPSSDKIEAIYIFPLPQNAAVDDMTLEVGGRVIRGLIKKREEAQQIYQNARRAGHTGALLDQERPNIFTQSVANIPPGATVKVKITYVEVLKYEAGIYEFVYPMVVGPRYIPGSPTGKQAGGWSPDTNQVPDASRITPLTAGVHRGVRGSRAGHDISVQVKLDAGVTVRELRSISHNIDVQNQSSHSAVVRLKNENEISNRDFILKYDVAGARIEDALLTNATGGIRTYENRGGGDSNATHGFFSFILQPPDRVRDEDATPRELIFVLDTSGSMSGFPLETAKKTMKRAIENMRPGDTFNFITFAGDTHVLFPQPVTPTSANIRHAIAFMEGQRGGGGTEMMKAIRTALGDSPVARECPPNADCTFRDRSSQSAVRIVCFMTDGYVGNDMAIIDEVQKHPEARVFSFGIGTAVNRFLLEKMAEAGRGEAEFVVRPEDATAAADRFYERVHTPVLTDISIDWTGLPVVDVLPARPLDLFTAKPLVITGKYQYPASGTIRLRGKRAGRPFEREIKVTLPGQESANQALAQLWARTKIHDLMTQDWNGLQNGSMKPALQAAITQLGLDYRLMTQFTSFVAVEEQTVVEGGRSRTIQVPVEMPQGVNPDTVFGQAVDVMAASNSPAPMALRSAQSAKSMHGSASGVGYGVGGGVAGGVLTKSSDAVAEHSVITRNDNELKDEKQKKEQLSNKLHPSVMAVFECWTKAGRSASANCAGLKNGKVAIQVYLHSENPEVLKRMLAAGWIPNLVDRSAGMPLSGTIAISRLAELANLPEVKLISLQK